MDLIFKGNLFDITKNDIKNYCKRNVSIMIHCLKSILQDTMNYIPK